MQRCRNLSWCVHYNGPVKGSRVHFWGLKNLDTVLFSVTISGLNLDAATQSKRSPNSSYYLWTESRIRSRFRVFGMHQGAISVRGGAQITVFNRSVKMCALHCRWLEYHVCRFHVPSAPNFFTHAPEAVSDFGILQSCTVRSISRCHAALRPGSHFSQALDKGAPMSLEK